MINALTLRHKLFEHQQCLSIFPLKTDTPKKKRNSFISFEMNEISYDFDDSNDVDTTKLPIFESSKPRLCLFRPVRPGIPYLVLAGALLHSGHGMLCHGTGPQR